MQFGIQNYLFSGDPLFISGRFLNALARDVVRKKEPRQRSKESEADSTKFASLNFERGLGNPSGLHTKGYPRGEAQTTASLHRMIVSGISRRPSNNASDTK